MKSLWHKPSCNWVTSVGDPDKTPRDKDCAACQQEEEATRPYQFTQREQSWQKQVNEMKKLIEKDPYQFLFGTSSERLRSIFPKSFLASSTFPWWENGTNGESQPYKTVEINAARDGGSQSSGKSLTSPASTIKATTGSSSTSGASAESSPTGPPGQLVFDPISMRMTRKDASPPFSMPSAGVQHSSESRNESGLLKEHTRQKLRPASTIDEGMDQALMRTKKTLERSWGEESAKQKSNSNGTFLQDLKPTAVPFSNNHVKVANGIDCVGAEVEQKAAGPGLDDYERRAGHDVYKFTDGEDGLEHKLVNSEISGNPAFAATLTSNNDHDTHLDPLAGYEDYEKKAGPGLYTFKSGEDSLESELASERISGNPITAATVNELEDKKQTLDADVNSGYEDYERKAGPDLYNFRMGQDNLEAKLLNSEISGNPTRAAGIKILDDRTAKSEMDRPSSSEIQAEIAAFSIPSLEQATAMNSPAEPVMRSEAVQQNSPSKNPELYQVLAYDPSNRSIHAAVASSSFTPPTGDSVLSVPDALSKLSAPAKFLPYVSKYQADGYEIVSASKHLLVLKQVRPDKASSESSASAPKPEVLSSTQTPDEGADTQPLDAVPSLKVKVNAVDNVTILLPQTGNFASPTGFVNHDRFRPEYLSISSDPANSSRAGTRVRKEEPVFSGGSLRPRSTATSVDSHVAQDAPEVNITYTSSRTQSANASGRAAAAAAAGESGNNDSNSPGSQPPPRWRHTMLIAFWTAICCYATGALVEYLRVSPNGGSTSAPSDPQQPRRRGTEGGRRRARDAVHATSAAGATTERSRSPLGGGLFAASFDEDEVLPSWLLGLSVFASGTVLAYLCLPFWTG